MGQKFRRNRSFAFYAEIQDGHEKWRENHFWEKSPVDSPNTQAGQKFCQKGSISLCFRDKHIFTFNTEIQDGCQKWQENDFGEKNPLTLILLKIFDIYLCHNSATNKKIAITHLWHEKGTPNNVPSYS